MGIGEDLQEDVRHMGNVAGAGVGVSLFVAGLLLVAAGEAPRAGSVLSAAGLAVFCVKAWGFVRQSLGRASAQHEVTWATTRGGMGFPGAPSTSRPLVFAPRAQGGDEAVTVLNPGATREPGAMTTYAIETSAATETTTGVDHGMDVTVVLTVSGRHTRGDVTLLPAADGRPVYERWGDDVSCWMGRDLIQALRGLDAGVRSDAIDAIEAAASRACGRP